MHSLYQINWFFLFFALHKSDNGGANSSYRQANVTKVDLPYGHEPPTYTSNTDNANKYALAQQQQQQQLRKGIVLNPTANSVANIYNQESTTDENAELNHSRTTQRSSSTPPPVFSVQNNQLTTEIIVKDDSEVRDRSRSESEDLHSLSISSKNNPATASLISNPTYKELARNESFYLNEFSSVKL